MSRGSVWSRGIRRAENKQGPRRSLRKRCIASASGLVAAAALVAPAGSAASAAEPVLTDFALAANGFSTQVTGGALPVESGRTGSVGLSCTRFAGRTNTNNTAAVGIPARRSLVRVGVTTSRAYTTTEGDTVSSNGVNDVASVLIGSKAVAGLVIRGIRTRTRVWHDSAGFHREQVITVAGVTRYVGGEGENVAAIPTNQNLRGQRLRLPGLATINFGIRAGSVSDNHAAAKTKALRIEITATGTEVVVGGSGARIEGGDVNGLMTGQVWGSQVRGLGGIANSGRTAAQGLSCVGTGGSFEVERVAAVRIPGVAALGEIVSRARGSQTAGGAFAEGISTVTGARFLGRQLVVTGVRARGLVNRSNDGTFARIARGTTVARIELGGRRLELPRAGRSLVIPGIARITRGIVERPGSNTIKVVGLRIQLLEGSRIESTVDLANVLLKVKRG